MHRFCHSLLAASFMLFGTPAAHAAGALPVSHQTTAAKTILVTSSASAKAYVDAVASQVITTLQDTKKTLPEKQQILNQIVDNHIDIDFVARFVLGQHWRLATNAQRDAYLAAYRPFLHKNYVGKLTRYSGQSYVIKTARADTGGDFFVVMEIQDPQGQPIEMDYRLQTIDGKTTIADITVEGVSLITTQRSEFNAIVTSKGLEYLIQALQKQAAKKDA